MRISVTRTTPMCKRSGRPLGARPWVTTATCTAALTSCCSLTCSRPFGGPAKSSTAWTLLSITPVRAFRDALLKKTSVELELLTDYDQHLFIEKGLRGGISMASKRHARANNPLVEGYDPGQPSSHILYLDANNLYGWAMSQYLPTGGFRWVDDCQQLAKTIAEQPADSPEGHILEVDLEYPEDLHNAHNSYPLAPERMVVKKEWMSEYQHNLLGVGVAPTEVEKLVPNLRNKDHYVLHYRNLQLYMSLGMRLTKVHRALRFDQSPWMEPYIRMNTELRKKAASGFEKDLYKLMNNSVFGKAMENLRRRIDVKLVRSNEEDRRLIASPAFARVISSMTTWQLSRSARAAKCSIARCSLGWAFWISPSTWCTTSITTSSGGSTGIVVSSSTPTPTASSSRSRPRMSSGTWPPTQRSTTPQTTHRSTHYTTSPTKRCWGRWRTSVQGAPLPNVSVCAQRCTQSLKPGGGKHQEGKGREKECREKAHQAWAVQRGSLPKANLPQWHGCPEVRPPSHLRAAPE